MSGPTVPEHKPLSVARETDGRVTLTVQQGADAAIATMSPTTALWLAGQLMDAANVSVLVGHRGGDL